LFINDWTPIHRQGISADRRMAGTDDFDVTINAVGGHDYTPNAAKDPAGTRQAPKSVEGGR